MTKTKSVRVEVDCTAPGCDNGVLPGNKCCPSCNGSGYVIVYTMVEDNENV